VARAVGCSLGGDYRLDTEQAKTCVAELWERLVEDPEIDADLALAEHPLEEIVLRLCHDMGIHPDPAWLNPEYSGAEWGGRRRLRLRVRALSIRRCRPLTRSRCASPTSPRAAG